MISHLKLILVVIYTLISSLVFAMPDAFPETLIFKGRPIDPLCFFETGEQQGPIDLNQCGLHSEPGRSPKGQNTDLTDQGYFGYDYSWDMDNGPGTQGYSYYKVIGNVKDDVLIQTVNNSGGTGEFTTLSLVEHQGNQLILKTLASGDRCNHGVDTASIVTDEQGDKIVYSVRMTPYDFISLAKSSLNSIKAYDDIDACAACCLGVAVFSRPFSDLNKELLSYVEITDASAVSEGENVASGVKYQSCFNQILSKYIQTHHLKIEPNELKQLVYQFKKTCIKKK